MAKRKVKQILIWRNDLKVRKGKIATQIAHGSVGALLSQAVNDNGKLTIDLKKNKVLKDWIEGRFTKICLYCNSEQELLDLHQQAQDAKLICCLITDAGLTEFNGVPTRTCLAIGPAYEEDVNKITGHLSILD